MRAKDIVYMTAYKVNQLSKGALNEAYQTLKSVFNKRVRTFAKHDALGALPKAFRDGLPSARGMTQEEKLHTLRSASAFMRGERSTYSGYRRSEIEQMESLNELLGDDFHFDSLDDFKKYGEFMGEMQSRLGEMWKFQSSQVRELYFQSQRLNVDPRQFNKNFEYWLDHAEELQEAEPLNYKGRGVKASDYARQLKLPKISDWYRENDYDKSVSSKLRKKKKK